MVLDGLQHAVHRVDVMMESEALSIDEDIGTSSERGHSSKMILAERSIPKTDRIPIRPAPAPMTAEWTGFEDEMEWNKGD